MVNEPTCHMGLGVPHVIILMVKTLMIEINLMNF
jgi:hypothetical protein